MSCLADQNIGTSRKQHSFHDQDNWVDNVDILHHSKIALCNDILGLGF